MNGMVCIHELTGLRKSRLKPQTGKNFPLSAFEKDCLGQACYKWPIQQSLNTRIHFVLKNWNFLIQSHTASNELAKLPKCQAIIKNASRMPQRLFSRKRGCIFAYSAAQALVHRCADSNPYERIVSGCTQASVIKNE